MRRSAGIVSSRSRVPYLKRKKRNPYRITLLSVCPSVRPSVKTLFLRNAWRLTSQAVTAVARPPTSAPPRGRAAHHSCALSAEPIQNSICSASGQNCRRARSILISAWGRAVRDGRIRTNAITRLLLVYGVYDF
ncbi:hypothetical protein EVAR_63840_1 [Eumeta japonica]|uniref:Uncharacterized protein n=1 Tax=Eumeta variegata TaxID=151549 RepID=A0A4C1ZBN4_EUMVA|nr:hypothetical protein EVAR_63840_1 [Eumeta japonica]